MEFGKRILKIVPGRVSTEVDARLSYDTEATIAKGRDIIAQYDAGGIERERVLIKIAITWEGIRKESPDSPGLSKIWKRCWRDGFRNSTLVLFRAGNPGPGWKAPMA